MPDIQPLDEDLLRDVRAYEADGLALLQLDEDDVLALGCWAGNACVRMLGTGVGWPGMPTPAPLVCSTAATPGSSTPCGG